MKINLVFPQPSYQIMWNKQNANIMCIVQNCTIWNEHLFVAMDYIHVFILIKRLQSVSILIVPSYLQWTYQNTYAHSLDRPQCKWDALSKILRNNIRVRRRIIYFFLLYFLNNINHTFLFHNASTQEIRSIASQIHTIKCTP